jgi:tetratricopeptide (TPR) repeat protein
MDAQQADVLRTMDPAELGQRLRAARLAKGMTQGELAGAEVSIGYISRIESGQRRPNGKVLAELAGRLGTSVEQLLRGVAPRELDEIRLTLDFAELSLESGEPAEALARAAEGLERAEAASLDDMAERGRYLHARALEGLGRLDDAIIELESLATRTSTGLLQAKAGIALSRCLRESGDLGKAIDTAEGVLERLAESKLDSTDEAVQLTVTLAAAYFERGDAGQAVRVCRRAVAKAETVGSPTARASAYWNASLMEAESGAVRDAIPLAERALALLGEGQDARNLARLRTQLGVMQLHVDPPQVPEAQHNLEQAARELAWSSAGPVDVARNDLALGRALYLEGDLAAARTLAIRVFAAVIDHAPSIAAAAKALEGQTWAAQGDTREAVQAYRQAVHILTGVGADRSAAQLWFDLAGHLEDVGEFDAARDAYRSAACSTGLHIKPKVRVSTSV